MHRCLPQVFEAWHQHRQRRGLHRLLLHHVNTNACTRFHTNNRFPLHQQGTARVISVILQTSPHPLWLVPMPTHKHQKTAAMNQLCRAESAGWEFMRPSISYNMKPWCLWFGTGGLNGWQNVWQLSPHLKVGMTSTPVSVSNHLDCPCTRLARIFLDHLYPKCSLHPISPTQWWVWMLISPLHVCSRSSWEQGTINHCTGYLSDIYIQSLTLTLCIHVCVCVSMCACVCACLHVRE